LVLCSSALVSLRIVLIVSNDNGCDADEKEERMSRRVSIESGKPQSLEHLSRVHDGDALERAHGQ